MEVLTISAQEETIEYFQAVIAGKKIEIECKYRDVFRTCRGYLKKFDTPDFVIPVVTPAELEEERLAAIAADKAEGHEGQQHSDAGLETLVVHRKIAEALLPEGFLLIHGAAVAAGGKCYLFMAKSGTGKTTHIQKWMSAHPDTYVVNGDKPFVDVKNRLVYGSPWCGKEKYGANTSAELGGLVRLCRGETNEIERISFSGMLPCLLNQCHIPNASDGTMQVMRLLGQLQSVPCWQLRCNLDEDAGEVSYRALVENK